MAIANTICRLVYGGITFDLNDKIRFLLGDGFTPPAADTRLNVTGPVGSSGGRVVDTKATDRQFAFQVIAIGSNFTETDASVKALQQFLRLATNGATKMYLEYCVTGHIPYRPTWGQAGWSRYEIKFGQASMPYYSTTASKTNLVNVGLVIGPYKLGLEQAAMFAGGGVWEDNLFSPTPRGVQLLPNATNLCTNPIFAYPTNYLQGWTVGVALATRLADEEFLYRPWGKTMIEVMNTGGVQYDLTQSITCTAFTHNFVCYVKRKDNAVLTDTQLKMKYNGVQLTTTFKALANGWYRLSASATGTGVAAAAGISIMTSWQTYYITGFTFARFQETSYPPPFFYGDMPGYNWSGEPHNSTTVSQGTMGFLWQTHDAVFGGVNKPDQGTIRVAFRWGQAAGFGDATGYDQVIIGGRPTLYVEDITKKLTFYDGTYTTQTAGAMTYAEGDLWIVHIKFGAGQGGLKVFVNGVLTLSRLEYTGSASAFNFYLGSDLGYNGSTYFDLTVWREVATDEQIAADYAEVYEQITGGPDTLGQRLHAIPWVLEPIVGATAHNYQYNDGSTHADYVVAGGIDGDAPAITKLELTLSTAGKSVLLGLNSFERIGQVYPPRLFANNDGTAWGGALGGQVNQKAVNTTDVDFKDAGKFVEINGDFEAFRGREFYAVISVADAGANLTGKAAIDTGGGLKVVSDYVSIAATGTLKRFWIGPLVMPEVVTLEKHPINFDLYVTFKRTVAGSANVSLDFMRFILGKIALVSVADATTKVITYDSERFCSGYSASNILTEKPLYKGSTIEFEPNQYNFLFATHGALATDSDLTGYLDVTLCKVTPRWSLL